MTIGSGGISRGPSRVGISENFIREHSRIYQQKHLNNDSNDQTRCPEKNVLLYSETSHKGVNECCQSDGTA